MQNFPKSQKPYAQTILYHIFNFSHISDPKNQYAMMNQRTRSFTIYL
ncbi:hypothetical protein EDB95_0776 [Dinghuibacter silviterrae]|uniref:Uncharacterized protein n=1 Tax=Dinghuibacter silviterrae TaxID=1539049 RepID=A0A4R8DPT4_9BACT|nr:hypothetical protein EDB95_0776 [Dinghuibacter silviterrae]